eukprot:3231990-Pleurochrysis_carterae.AAC.1
MASGVESPESGSLSGRVLLSGGSRCVGVLTVSGPEGLGTANTPIPLALRWRGVVVFDPKAGIRDACRRLTKRSGDF